MIGLEVLRTLNMKTPTQAGRGAFVSAASALVRAGDSLYVVADDEASLAIFAADDLRAAGHWTPLWDEAWPIAPRARKAAKADLEAAILLPSPLFPPHGALLLLPSGSAQNRFRGLLMGVDRAGRLTGVRRAIDTKILYDALLTALHKRMGNDVEELSRLNIEGVAITGDEIWFFNRGNDTPAINAVFVCGAAHVMRLLIGPAVDAVDAEGAVRAIRFPKLGVLDGLPLTFTDACTLDSGYVVFTATAEDTRDAVEDGEVKGSVVGVLGRSGEVVGIWPLEGKYKIEGLDAREDGEHVRLLLAHDADDPGRATELLAGTLPWRAP